MLTSLQNMLIANSMDINESTTSSSDISGFGISHPWSSGIEIFKNIILNKPSPALKVYVQENNLNLEDIVEEMIDYMYVVCDIDKETEDDSGFPIFSTVFDNSKLKIRRDYIHNFGNKSIIKRALKSIGKPQTSPALLSIYKPDSSNPGLSYLGQYPLNGSIMFGNGSADKNAPKLSVLEGWVVDMFNGDKMLEITDTIWRESTEVTVKSIKQYLIEVNKKIGKNIVPETEYKALRLEKGNKIQNLFNEVVVKLSKYYQHSNRNSYNPSDIFVYRKSKENDIIQDLESILEFLIKAEAEKIEIQKNKEIDGSTSIPASETVARDIFLKLTAVDYDIVGISLKKLSKNARNVENVLDLVKEKNYTPENRTDIEINDISVNDKNPNAIHFQCKVKLISPSGNRGYNGNYDIKVTFRNYGAKQIDKKILKSNKNVINGKVQLGCEIVFKGAAAISGKIRIGLIRDILGPGIIDKGFEANINHISDAISLISKNRKKIMQSDNFKAIIKAGLHEEDSSLPFIVIS